MTSDERRRKGSRLLGALLAVLLGLSACGKKGDPSPPLPRGPNPVKDLTVEQEGGDALLTFTYPDRLLTGQPLTDLDAVEIYRLPGATPSMAAPRAAVSTSSSSPTSTDHVPGSGTRRAAVAARVAEDAFYREAVRVGRLTIAELARRTHGATILYRDPLMSLLAKSASPPPLGYAVVSVRRGGEKSPLSNIVILTPDTPPGPPEILAVTPEEGRICIEWRPPEKDLTGAPAKVGGYKVYRRLLTEDEYGPALTPAPVGGSDFIDRTPPYGAALAYTVRATLPGKPSIEGLPAIEAALDYRDIYPPPAPKRLDALSEGKLVRLFWDPVSVADLAGYLVFRAEGDGAPARLTAQPIKDSFLTDEAVKPGVRYRYTIRAIDTTGNLGPPSPEAIAEPF